MTGGLFSFLERFVMQTKPETGAGTESARPRGAETAFSGYWFKVPSETDALMRLKPLELKVYLVIARAIQRDLNKGLISIRQIQERTHSGSLGCTQEAVDAVCSGGFFTRHNPKTGTKLTDPEDWKAREVEYRLNIEWKQSNADNCSAVPEQLRAQGENRDVLSNASMPHTANCSAVPEQNCSAVPEQHSESSELLLDLKTSSGVVHHHQAEENLCSTLAALAPETSLNRTDAKTATLANGSARTKPLESQRVVDDEKTARRPAAPITPQTAFLLRVAERHPGIDAPACLVNVRGELRKGAIPLEAYLRRDLLCTTNPKALTNPRGYYRKLAQTMVSEQAAQQLLEITVVSEGGQRIAGIASAAIVETPRCPCRTGYTPDGEFCTCKLGRDLAAIERRAAKKAAASVERKQPETEVYLEPVAAAGGLQ